MKRKTKILLIFFIIITMFSAQVVSPSLANAQIKLNWNRPNQGNNPYKFKVSDYLNPQMLTQVVGCTKVVNTISSSITGFIQEKIKRKLEEMTKKQIVNACQTGKKAIAAPLAGLLNVTVASIPLETACKDIQIQQTEDPEIARLTRKYLQTSKNTETKKQCLDGIAITLAKNQLAAMTRATMNWITTGFNGNPMYVRNVNSFMDSLTGTVLTKELNLFKDSSGNYNTADYPYARGFARTAVNARSSAESAVNSLKQDLTSHLKKGTTIKQYANNFSTGGWSGWLALTQHSQNNPLGFTMDAAQKTANKQAATKKETQDNLNQNGGFLSQKKCVVYANSTKRAGIKIANNKVLEAAQERVTELNTKIDSLIKNDADLDILLATRNELTKAQTDLSNVQNAAKKAGVNINTSKKCEKWEVVTPGSIIKDKISTYINSPERQLELVKTINDSLSVLFSALIDKFRLNGLTSLGSVTNNAFTHVSGGFGSNSLVDVTGEKTSATSGSFDMSKPFDLTKDLGNNYYHVRMTDLGKWNAKSNLTENGQTLYIDTAPFNMKTGEQISNVYYTVNKGGDTQLFRNGYSVWNKEDRAYFDGKHWQNWKCLQLNESETTCIKRQPNPIAKRGIFQVQQDYIVIAKQLLRQLPGIMPKIGELDYCIPGPNPNWQANSSKSAEAFTSFVNALETKYTQGGFLKRKYVIINPPMGKIYNTYKNVFNGTDLWPKVIKTKPYEEIKYLSSSSASPTEGHTIAGKIIKWLFGGGSSSSDNGGGKWRGGKQIAEANDRVGNLKNEIMKNYSLFNTKYAKRVEDSYGKNSLMQKQFLEKESTPVLTPNPSFLRVAPDALKITQNILAYNDSITEEAKTYREGIAEANLNIYKLKIIGEQVSKIVEAAQARRAKKLTALKFKNTHIKIQAGENIVRGDLLYNSGTNTDGYPIVKKYNPDLKDLGIVTSGKANKNITINSMGTMTKGTISDWTIPVSCLTEENLDYYTSNDLMVDFGGSKNERCHDGIDNDLNGLVDAQDPACKAYYKNNDSNDMNDIGTCRPDPSSEVTTASDKITSITCESIKKKNICLNAVATYSNPDDQKDKRNVGCIWIDSKDNNS